MTRPFCAFCLLLFCSALLMSAAAVAGDEDEKPAYLIYIDPETGKYTTEDPEVAGGPEMPAGPVQNVEDQALNLPLLLLAAVVIFAMLVGGLYRQQRKPLS